MVPAEGFIFEEYEGEDYKDGEGDYFLYYFELHEREGATVFFGARSVGGYLQQVFEEGNAPTDQDDDDQRKVFTPLHVFKLEVPVPGECHEGVGEYQEADGDKCFHVFCMLLSCGLKFDHFVLNGLYCLQIGEDGLEVFFLQACIVSPGHG